MTDRPIIFSSSMVLELLHGRKTKPRPMTCLEFEGIPVRNTGRAPDRTGRIRSNLYCTRGVSVLVPWE